MALVLYPTIVWLLIAGFIVVLLLIFPPYLLACSAVVMAVFSRLLVAWGIAPGFINFLHFPIAVASTFLAFLSPYRSFKSLSTRLAQGIGALGTLSVISWLASGGNFLKMVLMWLLFAEPFFILYAVLKTTPTDKVQTFSRLSLSLTFAQIPFALWQAATLGLGDVVQGTLIGHGAGAHVVGAITLMGVITLASGMLSKRNALKSFSDVLTYILIITILFVIPVLSDAKQVIIVFSIAFIFLLWNSQILRAGSLFISVTMVALIILAGHLYQPLRMATDMGLVLAGLGGKVLSYQILVRKMMEFPLFFIIGLGPGNSVTRAALAAQEGYIRSLPSNWIDFSPSPIMSEILSESSNYYLFASSSAWSGISSWLGLFGDLGLLGVATYLWILWAIWRALKHYTSPRAQASKAILVMGVVLGILYSWLEIPEFTLLWALYMAVGLVETKDESSTYPHLLSATWRRGRRLPG